MLYESTSGNQVDGLPLIAHTGAGSICRPIPIIHCPVFQVLARLVLEILLWDFDERLGIDRYMYDLDSDKGRLIKTLGAEHAASQA